MISRQLSKLLWRLKFFFGIWLGHWMKRWHLYTYHLNRSLPVIFYNESALIHTFNESQKYLHHFMSSFLYHETLFMTNFSMEWKYMYTLPMRLKRISWMISPLCTSLLVELKAGSQIKRSDLIDCLNRFNQDSDNDISASDEIICIWVIFISLPGYWEYKYVMRCILRKAYSLT